MICDERRIIMKRKITAIIAAAFMATLMGASAGAQGPVEQIGDGAGDIIENAGDAIGDAADGVGDAANDVLDGAGNAVDEITGGDDDTVVSPADGDGIGITAADDDLAEITDDDDTADIADDDDVNDRGKIAEAELYNDNSNDGNPSTGVLPFMTAGLVAVSAAGVAYLTKKRNTENGQ